MFKARAARAPPFLSGIVVPCQNKATFGTCYRMWHRELLSTTITVSGEVQGKNAIPDKNIVLEFLP